MNATGEVSPIPNCTRSLAGRPRKTTRSALAPYVRCQCGDCLWCRDNAKWDKIFEKFLDHSYYAKQTTVSITSPLADF